MHTTTRRAVVAGCAVFALFAAPMAALAEPAGPGAPQSGGAQSGAADAPQSEPAAAQGAQGTAESTGGAGQAEGVVTLDLYNLTDVHGHIEQVTRKGTVTEAGLPAMNCYLKQASGTNPNSSFTLLGDNIGASPYTSGALNDNPTIAALNTMNPLASTIGNHELDMGQAVFKQRVDGSNPDEYVQVKFP